jgi:outer membrane immunogenic protein
VKKSILWVSTILMFGTVGAAADEMPNRPSYYITGPTSSLPWTGFFVGINGGYGWANSTLLSTGNDPASIAGTCGGVGKGTCLPQTAFTLHGGTFGGQVGYDWQINPLWLTGIETDFQWSDFSSSAISAFHLGNVGNTNLSANVAVNSFGTLRARMGAIPINSVLVYGTAGLAYGSVSRNYSVANPLAVGSGSVSSSGFSYNCSAAMASCFAGSSSGVEWGWTIGGGGEYRITNNLTLKTEVLYVQLAAPNGTAVAQGALAGTTPSSLAVTFPSVKLIVARGGLNFRF